MDNKPTKLASLLDATAYEQNPFLVEREGKSEIGRLFELSKPATNVFLHLSKVMDYENKALFVYTHEYKKLGYKAHNQALLGLRELITKDIIAIKQPHVYWLDPAIVCKNEPLAVHTESVKPPEDEEKKKGKKLNFFQFLKSLFSVCRRCKKI